ncbi:MAG: hypothetical protein ACP5P4_06125 [Steroidobacteraceae bacterium]
MNLRVVLLIGSALLPALAALSGCTEHISTSSRRGSFTIEGTAVRISVPGESNAYVHASGRLVIARRTVALTPSEQTLTQQYYLHALGISAAGAAAGEAGGRLGVDVVGSLFSALWNGDSSIIKRTARRGSTRVRSDVRALCGQMARLRAAQNALAVAVAAFAPYRIVRRSDVAQCLRGAKRHTEAKS